MAIRDLAEEAKQRVLLKRKQRLESQYNQNMDAEGIIRKHCNLEYDKNTGDEMVVSSLPAVCVAVQEYADQFIQKELIKCPICSIPSEYCNTCSLKYKLLTP